MSRDVVTVHNHRSLREAAQMLLRARVSGAPVVDGAGRCVGVLSTTDFVRLAGTGDPARAFAPHVACDWQVFDLEGVPDDSVQKHMTADPVTVPPEMPLGELARRMLDAHIHRVIVVDAERRPVGIVSTTDILAAVARFAGDPAMTS